MSVDEETAKWVGSLRLELFFGGIFDSPALVSVSIVRL